MDFVTVHQSEIVAHCVTQPAKLSRQWLRHSLIAAALGLLAPVVTAHPFESAEIHHPKASFIDVPARMAVLRSDSTDAQLSAALPAAVDCNTVAVVVPPNGAMVIPPRYAQGNHGPVNPDYNATVELYRNFEDTAAQLANQYVASGQPPYAVCLINHLHRWAKADALMNYTVSTKEGASNQAWYQTEWSASAAALALSQVVSEPNLDATKLADVIAWLQRVSHKQISFPGGENTCCNNHAYWRGLHATMVGVLAGDKELYRWGLGRYAVAMEHLALNGSWPLEMARKEQALHYQNFALLPLVMIAEIAARQDLDLYAYQIDGRDLHSAVNFLAKTLKNPDSWATLGLRATPDMRAFGVGRGDQAWAEFYRARFGRDPLGLLTKPIFNARTGGSATLLVYRPTPSTQPVNAKGARP